MWLPLRESIGQPVNDKKHNVTERNIAEGAEHKVGHILLQKHDPLASNKFKKGRGIMTHICYRSIQRTDVH